MIENKTQLRVKPCWGSHQNPDVYCRTCIQDIDIVYFKLTELEKEFYVLQKNSNISLYSLMKWLKTVIKSGMRIDQKLSKKIWSRKKKSYFILLF